ncbi:hypothetical protein [Rhizobium sp. SSA_523]|uniref:hypothetical protein n=1 Tax=Rhizobium sp. SSA_523 TaxID=2952477 RepID=UPI00209094EA|nr:hypothetical protein [Rhizobium sp. SSA_523]MCO5733408.1 hypothetical protein [Rhizobium sp. SSA_523]
MSDREPTVINNNGRSGSAGWAVAVVILMAVIAVGFILFGGNLGAGGDIDVNVKLPASEAPAR